MDFSHELWWQNLEEWILDDGRVITYKNFACNMDVHVNKAKKMLVHFHQENQEKVSAFYLISGQTKNGFKVQMAAAKDVKKIENTFTKVLSKHMYALCKAKMDVTAADVLNCLTDSCSPNQMICLRGIKNLAIEAKIESEKLKKESDVEKGTVEKEETSKTQKDEETIAKSEIKKELVSETSNIKFKSSQNDKSKVKNSQNRGGLATLFANMAVKKPESFEKPPSVVEEPKVDSKSKVNSKKHDLSSSRESIEHKRTKMTSSFEDSSDNEKAKKSQKSKLAKKEPQVDSDDDFIPDTPRKPNSRKRRVRKRVDKPFVEECGLNVTKKKEKEVPMPKKPSENNDVKKSKPANENYKTQTRKQASIMDFVSRK